MSYELNSSIALAKSAIRDLETQVARDKKEGIHCCRIYTAIDELKRAVYKIESRLKDEH